MPDIGLLQGPPRARAIPVPPPVVEPEPVPEPLPMPAPEMRVAAHTAVVSERAAPIAITSAPLETDIPVEPAASEPAASEPASAPAVSETSPALPAADESGSAGEGALAGLTPKAWAGDPARIHIRDLLWLVLALLVIVGTGLGIRDPWPADEPRFASLARDMVATGDWLFPRVGGDLYQDKPPLFFWLLAICYTVFGAFKGWFLLPSFVAAGGILFLIYDFGRRTVGRDAGLAAAILVLCTVQFVQTTRGAQIDSTLCVLVTFSVYAFLRHLLLGHGWGWYVLGGFLAGLGVITKGVGFLPLLLVPLFLLMRHRGWKGLADIDAGAWGWKFWLAPLAMLAGVALWLGPMLWAVSASGLPELAAYRDEILFRQTVDRYATAWHHVKPWYYLVFEMIPPLWLPWSLLLFWLVPRFVRAHGVHDARVWLPLGWVMVVLLFFSLSPGKRGVYLFPALPALALASLPFIGEVIARRGVRLLGFALAAGFWLAAGVVAVGHIIDAPFAVKLLDSARFSHAGPVIAFWVLSTVAIIFAWRKAQLLAWPLTLAALALVHSYFLAPAINGKRSGEEFIRPVLREVQYGEQLGLVAYKEQFLLYLEGPSFNFGHRRWLDGPQETYDAAAWLMEVPDRVLLVPERDLKPCFTGNVKSAGPSSNSHWFLVRAPANPECVRKGNARRAIVYFPHGEPDLR